MRNDVPLLNVEVKINRNLFEGYRPHFRVADGEHLGISFEKVEPPSAMDTYRATVALVYPGVDYRALVEGAEFEILEGARVVGSGRVLPGGHHAI
jgi:translation elongation factor EF-Tu-like GTPase